VNEREETWMKKHRWFSQPSLGITIVRFLCRHFEDCSFNSGISQTGEVGIASMALERPVLRLNQITDNRLYSTTVDLIRQYGATTLLYPNTHTNSSLYGVVHARNAIAIDTRPRRTFSEDRGMERIVELTAAELDQRDLERRYLARAAAAALIRYIEATQEANFAKASLRVLLDDEVQGRLTMDAVSIRNLEILTNRRAVLNRKVKNGCLFDFVNFTVTKPGARSLRAELVCPPCNMNTIEERQGLANEFASSERLRDACRNNLQTLHDMDQLTTHYSVRPKKFTMLTLKKEVDNTIRLLENLHKLPVLEAVTTKLKSKLGKDIAQVLHSCGKSVAPLLASIANVLRSDTEFHSSIEEQRIEAIYCVRPGVDDILDVARKSYADIIAKMKRYVGELNSQHPDIDASLHFSAKRGYHLRVERDTKTQRFIGTLLVRAAFNKKTVSCTTDDLASLNLKQEQVVREALERSEAQLEFLRERIKTMLPVLFQLSESIAILDLVQGFACLGAQDNFSMPRIVKTSSKNSTPFKIEQGRHLLLENVLAMQSRGDEDGGKADEKFVPNNLALQAPEQNFALVLGPNCSGKSSFLKQTALITIMAHIGCFVPAVSAQIPLVDHVFTRIGTEDNLEANASTFSLEMTELAYILRAKEQEQSFQLVLIDELGRGTSSREGTALAWATVETLMKRSKTFTLFATHFKKLENISGLRILRFSMSADPTSKEPLLSHVVKDVTSQKESPVSPSTSLQQVSDYGIRLAEACAFPQEVIADANVARQALQAQRSQLEARQKQLQVLMRDAQIMSLDQLRKALQQLSSKK